MLELHQLRLEQLALVRVERLVLALAPPVGKARRDLAGKEPAEQRVARVRRRRRQHAEVVRRLDLEQRREQRLEMRHWSSRRQSTTMNTAARSLCSIGRRNSPTMSIDSGGRSPSRSRSQPGYAVE